MKNKLCLAICFILANCVFGQEKIYLQLSGTSFDTSETIWFKAVVTNAIDHTPTHKSGVLHVELIDLLNNQIIDTKRLKINRGIADSFFQLHPSFKAGKYMIRAYTEWNRNFGDDFITSVPINIYRIKADTDRPDPIQDVVFTKDLANNTFSVSSTIFPKLLDSLDKEDAKLYMIWKDGMDSIEVKPRKKASMAIKHNVPIDAQIIHYQLKTQNETFEKSIVLDKEYGSLQFFPEGGSLVAGLQSTVGFKYLDYRGKGAKVTGTIEDGDENKIADFESNTLGMGRVTLLPETGKTYYGVLTTKYGSTFKYKLPEAKKTGMVLRLIGNGQNKRLIVINKMGGNDSIFVKTHQRGRNLFLLKSRFKNGKFFCKLESGNLPRGIIGLTVQDKNHRPVAERHFFNEREEEKLNIELYVDQDEYAVRDSVQVSIRTKHKNRPVPASVSVMAIDSSYFYGTNVSRSTISSFFLLQSDVRGTVENPSYYFEAPKNLVDLDYLMLTQGWTNYKYAEQQFNFYQAEKGLVLRGTVGGVQKMSKRKRMRDNTYGINMLMMGDPTEVYTQEIDSTGYFNFSLRDSYGEGRKFVIQPMDKKNKSQNFKVNIKKREVPEITYEMVKVIVPVDSVIERKMVKKIRENIKYDPFLLPNTVSLDEVEVSDYKLTPERAEMADLHGMPDVVIENDELMKKKKNWTGNLYSWILFNNPDKIRVRSSRGNQVAYIPGAGWTYVVIDGIPVKIYNYGIIQNIPIEAVKSVEVIRSAASANTNYFLDTFECPLCLPPKFPGILAIYTYADKGLFGAFPGQSSLIKATSPQFSPIREYYVPEYQDPSKIDWGVPDRRSLVHWEPNVITNGQGIAKTTLFNSDITGKMMLICEGITANGKVGYTELFYEVEEKSD